MVRAFVRSGRVAQKFKMLLSVSAVVAGRDQVGFNGKRQNLIKSRVLGVNFL